MTPQQQAILDNLTAEAIAVFSREEAAVSGLNATITAKDAEIASLQAQLAAAQPSGDVASLQAQVDSLQELLNNVTQNRAEIQAELASKVQELSVVEGERNSLQDRINQILAIISP